MNRPPTIISCAAAMALMLVLGACGDDDSSAAEQPAATAVAEAAEAPPDVEAADDTSADETAAVDGESDPDDADADTSPEGGEVTVPDVGLLEVTFVDDSRATPASFSDPGSDSRSLRTLIAYPPDADPGAVPASPYPLVLFAHGLYSTPEGYFPLIAALADAGHVVVAPEFPRTGASNRGGPDARDNDNQPGDISFLIDSITDLADDPDWELEGLVDTERIVAAGHSNGAITTYGLVANSCCRDDRIDAAIPIAGTPAPLGGDYDFDDVVPMLFVHGTDDALIPYEASVGTFNELTAVKGLLTLGGGDHSSFTRPDSPFFDDVVDTIVDFAAFVLDGDADAGARLAEPRAAAAAELIFASEGGTDVRVESADEDLDRQVSVQPAMDLVDGQTVTVTWEGFLPGQVVNVVQCSEGGTGGNEVCEIAGGKILQPNPTGDGSLELEIIVGPVGTGTCDASTDDCVIVVNDAGLPDPDATIRIPISFAG